MRVITVNAENRFSFDDKVNREIEVIESNGGEVVNVLLAIDSVCDMYAMIVYRNEVPE